MKILHFAGGGFASACSGYFLGYFGASLYCSPPVTTADCAAWVGAIGSVGALFGAIWIASGQARRTAAKERELALLAAGSLILRLKALEYTLEECMDVVSDPRMKERQADYGTVAGKIRDCEFWTVAEVQPLAIFPGEVAVRMEIERTRLKQVISHMQAVSNMHYLQLMVEGDALREFVKEPAQKAATGISRVVLQLERALRTVPDI